MRQYNRKRDSNEVHFAHHDIETNLEIGQVSMRKKAEGIHRSRTTNRQFALLSHPADQTPLASQHSAIQSVKAYL